MTPVLGRLAGRGEAAAERRVRERTAAVAERLAEALPQGIEAVRDGDAVVLRGRGLRRRHARDAALRWMIEGVIR